MRRSLGIGVGIAEEGSTVLLGLAPPDAPQSRVDIEPRCGEPADLPPSKSERRTWEITKETAARGLPEIMTVQPVDLRDAAGIGRSIRS
jgi:hypothetical protein